MSVNINQGTQTAIATDTVGTVNYQVVKLDVGASGLSSAFTGTLGAVTNLAAGTVTALAKGTISAGTINTGTIDAISQLPPNAWGTVVSGGTSTLGTIKAAVAGSVIYVTHMIVSVGSASNVVIASGGTSTPIGGTYFFNANGGIVDTPINPPLQTTSGSALVYQQTANGPITITAGGFVR